MNQTNHYEHKDHVDLTNDYCYLCNVSISLDGNRATVERFLEPNGTDSHLETEVLSEDPEMAFNELFRGTTPEDLDELAAEMLAEMGSTK